ncbi:MAG: hypothetical protein IKT32_05685 [Clostridia bacterium]|nr:hypothetical protein [Clostridia bacterium]
MKKDLIFAPLMLVIGVLLCLLKVTGMTAHIAVSVVGVVVLIAYAVVTKKEWKIPALEIGMRAGYGIALLTGIVLKIKYISAVGIIHKIFALVFVVLLIVLFVQKLVAKKS